MRLAGIAPLLSTINTHQDGDWQNVDRQPNVAAAAAVEDVFRQVVAMSVAEPGAVQRGSARTV